MNKEDAASPATAAGSVGEAAQQRLSAFANKGPFTWRCEDGSTDFNALRADLCLVVSPANQENDR